MVVSREVTLYRRQRAPLSDLLWAYESIRAAGYTHAFWPSRNTAGYGQSLT